MAVNINKNIKNTKLMVALGQKKTGQKIGANKNNI